MSDLRRSKRLSVQSTTSNSDELWYLIFLPKVGTDGSYAIYTQSHFKITKYPNGLESIRVNNVEGTHGFEVIRMGNSF